MTERSGETRLPAPFGHLAAVVAVTFFASNLVVAKALLGTLTVWQVFAGQLVIAVVFVWPVLLVTRQDVRPRGFGTRLFGLGVLAPGMVNLLNIAGTARTDGMSVVIIWGLLPLALPLLGRMVLGEPVHTPVVLGALLGFAGTILIVYHRQVEGDGDALGNVLVLGAVFCSCAVQLLSRRINRDMRRPLTAAGYQITVSAVVALAAAAYFGAGVPRTGAGPVVLGQIVYLGIFGTVAVFFLLNTALARLAVGRVGLYLAMIPALGTVMAALFLAEPMGWREALGILAIFMGAALPALAARGRRWAGPG